MDRETLARQIGQVCRLSGRFELRSGQVSDEYFDKYLFEADPELLGAVADHAARLVPAGIDVLAGLELGGVPVVTALSAVTGHPAAFVRKEAKAYGTKKQAEGASIEGRRVLIVEDVITTGGQVVQSAADLRAAGALVDTVLCIIDRRVGGHDRLADAGLDVIALFSAADLIADHPVDPAGPAEHAADPSPGVLPSGATAGETAGDVEIRRATEADIEPLLDHIEAVAAEGKWLGTEAPIDRERRREWLQRGLEGDEDAARFVATVDGRIVGSLDVYREGTGAAELGMAVADGWRGLGTGTALMQAALSWAHDAGVHKIALQTWPHNDAARALYRRFGFVEEGRLVRHYRRRSGELWDAIVMGLVLDHDAPGSPYDPVET